MLQERPVEPDGWKNKLDRLDNLPGEPWVDKNAAWDKLYTRLHQKPGRKARPWRLAAAVFLLLVGGASLFIIHSVGRDGEPAAPDSPGRSNSPGKAKALVKNNPLPVHAGSPAPLPAVVQVEKSYPAATTSDSDSDGDGRRLKKTLPLTVQPAEPLHNEQVSITAPVIKVDTTVLASAMVLSSPKKLRVVHINELESPAGDEAQPGRQPNNRSFRLLLIHVDDARTVSYQTNDAGSNPLKMKIRTQN